jgi:DNA-binding NtrC family response regulator
MDSSSALVLMVEDDKDIHLLVREFYGSRLKLLSALTVEEGLVHFRAHRERLKLIILDASLIQRVREIHTLPILTEIKASNFRGPVISSTSDRELRMQMRALGCTAAIEKCDLLTLMSKYL